MKWNFQSGSVLKLSRGIYGIKIASRVWNQTFNASVKNVGLKWLQSDECAYDF